MMIKVVWILLLFTCGNLVAQNSVKRPLSIDDFGAWNVLSGSVISNDGTIVSYVQKPQQGDGMLVVDYGTSINDTIPRGSNVSISPENDFLVFEIKPFEHQVKKAKREKVKSEAMPSDSLGILIRGPQKKLHKFPHLSSYSIPEEQAKWIAFSIQPKQVQIDTIQKDAKPEQKVRKGNDLVLFEVSTADTIEIKDVSGWVYSKNGAAVWYMKEKKDSLGTYASIYKFDTRKGNVNRIYDEKGWIEKLTTDEEGQQCAFLFSSDTISDKVYSLFAGSTEIKPVEIVNEKTQGIPIGWAPSKNGNIYYSQDGTRIYFGTSEIVAPEPEDTITDTEKPVLDIWSWNDHKLQSQQLV
ncbi:MAG TPA: hypothetical protein VFD91_01775, partial [Mariniphaga sp.]|nr:hypothetical protein [Mariniphaga sp.]